MILAILLFGFAVFVGSFLITRNHRSLERSQLAFYIVLIAWGSLIAGIIVSTTQAAPGP